MDKYIKELLNLKNSVVLPEVGGLLKIGNNISINEYLKFNDGKLVAYLSEQKNIDSEEALKEVEAFCEEVKNKLEAEGEYTIKKLGIIKLIEGKLSFEVKSIEEKIPEGPVVEEKKEEASVKEKVEAPKDKKEKNEPVKEEPKEEEKTKKKQKQVVISDSSADLNEEDALEAIRNIDNKKELIAFAENDKRDSVSSFFLERLTYFNELKEEKKKVKKEESKEEIVVDKKEKKTEETKNFTESGEKKVKEEEPKEEIVTNKEEDKVEETKILTEVEEDKVQKEDVVETIDIKEETKVDKEDTSEKKQEFIESKYEMQEEISDETIDKIAEGAEKIESESKKRKKSRPFLWIGLILIISGAGILGYLKRDMIKGWFASEEIAKNTEEDSKANEASENKSSKEDEEVVNQHTEENSEANGNSEETNLSEEEGQTEVAVEEVITEDPNVVEETQVEEPVVEKQEPKEEISTPIQSTANGSYHVIVGSFSNVGNAEKLVKTLKTEGYSDAGILGKFGSLTSVKMGSYSSLGDAKSALQQSGKDGWIKKY